MGSNTRVSNLTRGYTLKFSQARRAVENCAAAWVEYGVSIRDLTLQESIQARAAQEKMYEPLPLSELRNIIYRPALGNEAGYRQEKRYAREADKYFFEVTQ